MLMSPAARRSVVGSIGFDANASIEESKSPTRPKAGRRATNQSSATSSKPTSTMHSLEEEPIDNTIPNKRRSRRLKDDPIIEEDDDQIAVNPSPTSPMNATNGDSLASQAELEAEGPPPQPTTNGWGGSNNQTNNTAIASNNQQSAPFGRRTRGAAANSAKEDDVIADLAEIPDVEAESTEDLTMQVAETTHLRSHVVPALTELDAQLQNPRLSVSPNPSINATINQTFASEIDLSLLFSCLTAPSIVYDSQNAWDFDTLLSDVASEMYAEGEMSGDEKDESSDEPKQSPRRQTTKAA